MKHIHFLPQSWTFEHSVWQSCELHNSETDRRCQSFMFTVYPCSYNCMVMLIGPVSDDCMEMFPVWGWSRVELSELCLETQRLNCSLEVDAEAAEAAVEAENRFSCWGGLSERERSLSPPTAPTLCGSDSANPDHYTKTATLHWCVTVCVFLCVGVFIHIVGTRLPFGDKVEVPVM